MLNLPPAVVKNPYWTAQYLVANLMASPDVLEVIFAAWHYVDGKWACRRTDTWTDVAGFLDYP